MSKAVPPPAQASFEELKARGSHSMLEAAEAIRSLQIVVRESAALRDRIDRIHHWNREPDKLFLFANA